MGQPITVVVINTMSHVETVLAECPTNQTVLEESSRNEGRLEILIAWY